MFSGAQDARSTGGRPATQSLTRSERGTSPWRPRAGLRELTGIGRPGRCGGRGRGAGRDGARRGRGRRTRWSTCARLREPRPAAAAGRGAGVGAGAGPRRGGAGSRPTIRSVLAQTGVADLEVLVLDDESTDGTAAVVLAVAAGDPRLTVLPGTAPPPGVLGKPHACAQLAARRPGPRAGVRRRRRGAGAARGGRRGRPAAGRGARPAVPVAAAARRRVGPPAAAAAAALVVDGARCRCAGRSARPRPSMVAANGQFMVVDAAALAAGRRLRGRGRAGARRHRAGPGPEAGRGAGRRGQRLASSRRAACTRAGARSAPATASRCGRPSARRRPRRAVGALLAVTYVVPPVAALLGSRARASSATWPARRAG